MLPIYLVLLLGGAAVPSSGEQGYCSDGQCNDPQSGESGESMLQVKQESSLQSQRAVVADGDGEDVAGDDQAAVFRRLRKEIMRAYGSEASILESMEAKGLPGTLRARVDAILSSGNAKEWEEGLNEYIEHACRILDTEEKVTAFGFLGNITAVAMVGTEMKPGAEGAFGADGEVIEEMCIHRIYTQLIVETGRGDHADELSALLQRKPHLEAALIQQTHGSREGSRLAPNRTQGAAMTVAAIVYHFGSGSCDIDQAMFGFFGLGRNPMNYGNACGPGATSPGCSGGDRGPWNTCKPEADGGMDYACKWHDENNHRAETVTGLPKSLCFVDYAFQRRRTALSSKARTFHDANGVNALKFREVANCVFDAMPCQYHDTRETCEFYWHCAGWVCGPWRRCRTTTGWHDAILLGHYDRHGSCGTKRCTDTRTCGGKDCCKRSMDCGLSQDGLS